MSADQNTLLQCSGCVADMMWTFSTFPLSDIHVRICVYGCVGWWRRQGVASEQSCLICAWGEKYPRVQCVMESRQKWGDLWEPNLKHCHDGSWKRVKVGGSVIFKDEPRGEADRKQGQIWPRKNGRRRRMQSYFHLDISLPLLLF